MTDTPTTDVIELLRGIRDDVSDGQRIVLDSFGHDSISLNWAIEKIDKAIRLVRAGVSRQGDEVERVARALHSEMLAIDDGFDRSAYDELHAEQLSILNRLSRAALKAIGGGSGYER